MIRPGDPSFAFSQLIGAYFHQDAFEDGADSIDEIIDEYLADGTAPSVIRGAAEGGRLLLSGGHDEPTLEAMLEAMGFELLPEPMGFAGHAAFVEHLVKRLEHSLGDAREQVSSETDPEPARELTGDERDGLSALLHDVFGSEEGLEGDIRAQLWHWSGRASANVVAGARDAVRALRAWSPLDGDGLDSFLRERGLAFDLVEHENEDLWSILAVIDEHLSRALGDGAR